MSNKREQESVIFTRYLYIKEEVETSLLLSILDKKKDEAFFWGYELYYSGYQVEVLALLSQIYHDFYARLNPNLGKFLNECVVNWDEHRNRDHIIGIIILNMVSRKYSLHNFTNRNNYLLDNAIRYSVCNTSPEYTSPNYTLSEYDAIDKKVFIVLNASEISSYRNKSENDILPNALLKTVCKYTPASRIQVSSKNIDNNIKDIYYYHWVYYASFSPIWIERIREFGGVPNNETRKIDFPDDESSDKFYELYDYEPDEQPMSVQNKNIPIQESTPLTWYTFIQKYDTAPTQSFYSICK